MGRRSFTTEFKSGLHCEESVGPRFGAGAATVNTYPGTRAYTNDR